MFSIWFKTLAVKKKKHFQCVLSNTWKNIAERNKTKIGQQFLNERETKITMHWIIKKYEEHKRAEYKKIKRHAPSISVLKILHK